MKQIDRSPIDDMAQQAFQRHAIRVAGGQMFRISAQGESFNQGIDSVGIRFDGFRRLQADGRSGLAHEETFTIAIKRAAAGFRPRQHAEPLETADKYRMQRRLGRDNDSPAGFAGANHHRRADQPMKPAGAGGGKGDAGSGSKFDRIGQVVGDFSQPETIQAPRRLILGRYMARSQP